MINTFFLVDSDEKSVRDSELVKIFSSDQEFYEKIQEFSRQSQGKKFILNILCHGAQAEDGQYYLELTGSDGSDKKTDFIEFLAKSKPYLKDCLQLCVSSCHTPKLSSKIPDTKWEKIYLEKLRKNQDFTLLFRGRNGASSKEVFGHLMRSLIFEFHPPKKSSFDNFIENISVNLSRLTESVAKIFVPEFSFGSKISGNSIVEGFLEEMISLPIKLKILPFQKSDDASHEEKAAIIFKGPKNVKDLEDIRGFLKKELLRILDEWPKNEENSDDVGISSSRKRQLIDSYTKKIEDLSDTKIDNYLKFVLYKDLVDHKKPLPESSKKRQRINFLLTRFFTGADEKKLQITKSLIEGIPDSLPLHAATIGGDVGMIEKVLALTFEAFELDPNSEKELNLKSKDRGTVFLIEAIAKNKDEKNCLEIIKLFLNRGFHPDCVDNCGVTPLMHACTKGWKNLVKVLIDAGADVNAKDPQSGFCVLQIAISQNQDEIAKILTDSGALNDFVFRKNGDKYEGEWKNGKRDGFGKATLVEKNVIFEGHWQEGQFLKGKVIFDERSLEGLNSVQLEEKFSFITEMTSLQSLDLSENRLDEEAIKIVAQKLVLTKTLNELNLSSIQLSQVSLEHLRDALQSQNCKILKITIDNKENQGILDQAIKQRQKIQASTNPLSGPIAILLNGGPKKNSEGPPSH